MQFAERASRLSKYNQQIQTENRFLFEETIENMNDAKNCNQEEIYPNKNIVALQKEKDFLDQQFLLRKNISDQKVVTSKIKDIGT